MFTLIKYLVNYQAKDMVLMQVDLTKCAQEMEILNQKFLKKLDTNYSNFKNFC